MGGTLPYKVNANRVYSKYLIVCLSEGSIGVFLLIVKHIDTSDGKRQTKGLQSDTLAPHI